MALYRVTHGEKERLVEASNVAGARNFAARGLIEVEVAKASDIFRLAKAGVEVEVATGAAEGQAIADAAEEAPQGGEAEGGEGSGAEEPEAPASGKKK